MTKLLVREAAALETRRAPLRPSSYNAEAGTIEAVISTGAAVARRDATGNFMEVLDTSAVDLTALRGISVLNSHRQNGLENVLGVVEEARLEGGNIVARMRLSSRPEVASIVAGIRSGEINSLSIGYEVSQWADGTDANGQRTRTATQWSIREVSFVAVPADPAARTRGATNQLIRSLGQQACVSQSTIDGLIDRGATEQEARAAILDELLARSNNTVIRTSSHNVHTMDNPEAFVRAAGEALYARNEPSHQPSGAARQYVGMSVPDIAREILRRNGSSVIGLSANGLIERAMTTSDFPLILGDTMGRTMRASYNTPASGVRLLARQMTLPDFREKTSLMLDSTELSLEKVGELGEFKAGSLLENGEAIKLSTFGRILALSRQALVNDNLSAFSDLFRRLGQAAQAFEAAELVKLLEANPVMKTDGKAVFHADHGNLAAAGAPPSETTISAARLAMREQTGLGGNALISVTPKYILIPSALETTVEKLLTTIQAMQTSDVNVFAGKLTPVVEPRLTSATKWWLFADKSEIDGMAYAHLAGEPGPQTSSKVGFEVDGVQMKVRLDFGCAFLEYRGAYQNAGA